MQVIEKGLGGSDGKGGDLADVLVIDQNSAGFSAEALAPAVGAEGVAAVLGEEDADVEFVFFAFEGGEKAAEARVGTAAFP